MTGGDPGQGERVREKDRANVTPDRGAPDAAKDNKGKKQNRLVPAQAVGSRVRRALMQSRGSLLAAALFSAAVNVLMLTGPMFMLQVYDRVLTSRSVPTLVALFLLVVALYLFLGAFDFLRARVLERVAARMDASLARLASKIWLLARARYEGMTQHLRPLNDLGTVRQFLSSNAVPAFFDLPSVPLYLFFVFLLHPYLGILASCGAVVVIVATVFNEVVSRRAIAESMKTELEASRYGDAAWRSAEAIVAMGMTGSIVRRIEHLRHNALAKGQKASFRSGIITAGVKSMRMILQSGILGLGAWLAIQREITPGAMIAASILGGRALAPIDVIAANWRAFLRARQAWGRLKQIIDPAEEVEQDLPLQLPKPKSTVVARGLVKFAPTPQKGASPRIILQDVSFALGPGEALGVIGPSASGKTTLARLLTGIWMPDRGEIRLDGATLDQWDRDALGRYIGYLPQRVELMQGSVRDNIARFDETVSDEEVIAAAKLAGVHELILSLPDGYATPVHDGGLTAGQAQRIALARAVLRMPSLVVLDEPNANLDMEGDQALTSCIEKLKAAGSCVVVMAHRPSAIAATSHLMVLQEGRVAAYGPRDEVLRQLQQSHAERRQETVEA